MLVPSRLEPLFKCHKEVHTTTVKKDAIEVKNMHKTYDEEVQDIYDKIRKIDWA